MSYGPNYDELNDNYNYLQGQSAPQSVGVTQSVNGVGIGSIQGLTQSNILFEGAATGVRATFSTNGTNTVVVLIAGVGVMATKAQLANQSSVAVLGGTAPGAYDAVQYGALMAKLDALITAFNALLTEMQTQGHMA